MSVVDKIHHYQRSIEKCCGDEERMLHCISKLHNLPVTVQHLQETGVGRTVNALRKYDGGVGNAAKALVAKWKAMVADEETSDGEDEDEACVPDVPECYSDSPESPKANESITVANHSRHKSEELKQLHRHKAEKSGSSSTHSSKHVSKQEKSKYSGNETKPSNEVLKAETEKQKKHEKHRHSQKYESKSEKKLSSKDSKSNKCSFKRDEGHSSKDHSHKSESFTKSSSSDKSSRTNENKDDHHKKRKGDSLDDSRKESKRRKSSDNESDEENKSQTLSDLEKSSSEVKIKQEPSSVKDKESSSKSESKREKKSSPEKLKSSSSKHKSESGKPKNEEEKKQKKDGHAGHKKSETKKDSSHHSSKDSDSKSHQHSSSSGKNHDKSKDKSKKRDSQGEESKQKNKSSSESKDKHSFKEPKEVTRIKQELNGDEGIDCNSGASFAEALGMCSITQPSRKRSNNSPNVGSAKSSKSEPTSSSASNKKPPPIKAEPVSDDSPQHTPSLLAPNVKLEPLSVDLASTLPEISPNYKPLPYINPIHRKEEDKILTDVIYVKNQRTKVYSGNKSGYTSVPSLYDICMRILIENIDALEFTGGVPYDILKPILERATADQLFMLEHYNPYLIEDTDPLWQYHCNREFRNKQREEMETWREMYMRCLDEREAKLKTLTANIKQSIDKSVPVRSTKLAYVDNVVKPPRNILKKQAKYGTANAVPTSTSDLKKKLISGGGPNAATNISVPPPAPSRAKTSTGVVKKTKAPLMAKALQLIKGRYKR